METEHPLLRDFVTNYEAFTIVGKSLGIERKIYFSFVWEVEIEKGIHFKFYNLFSSNTWISISWDMTFITLVDHENWTLLVPRMWPVLLVWTLAIWQTGGRQHSNAWQMVASCLAKVAMASRLPVCPHLLVQLHLIICSLRILHRYSNHTSGAKNKILI